MNIEHNVTGTTGKRSDIVHIYITINRQTLKPGSSGGPIEMWLCEWEAIYGVYPVEKAWKDDKEPFVITEEGDKICKSCADKWHDGKQKQQEENRKAGAK